MQYWKYKIAHRMVQALLLTALWSFCSVLGDSWVLAATAEPTPPASLQKLVRGHWSEKPEVMRKNHQALLRDGMENGVRAIVREDDATIERCVTCHIVRNEQGQPRSATDPKHFCRDCHNKERVFINCFVCHASLPVSDPAIMGASVRNADSLKARLQEWQNHQQGGAKK